MRSSELAGCPFCGAMVDFGISTDCADESRKSCSFICDNCGAVIDFNDSSDFTEEQREEMQRNAVASWNRRSKASDSRACPFCGSSVEYTYYPAEDEFENDECDVVCDGCGMHANFYEAIGDDADVRGETERLWGQRAGKYKTYLNQ